MFVKDGITRFLQRKLKLKVNEKKSAVARPWHRKFLGFSFTVHRTPKRRIAPDSLTRFRFTVRRLTRRTRGIGVRRMIVEVGAYVRGWLAYFGICETPSVLRDLDSWILRRFRCVIWKHWRRARRRYRALLKLGIPQKRAALMAKSRKGYWRVARSPTLNEALPIRLFRALGLRPLAPTRSI